jgi:hypothetical protein
MFQKAQRKKAKLRLSIAGLSGTGKTWSALELATGMGGKIALIDTEAGRGELYGENFDYDCMQISAPYSPQKYINAIQSAEKLGYDILIIDSLSHAWIGEGGVLSIAEKAGGEFQKGWKTATPQHNLLVETIIQSKLHIIMTMRSKADYVVEINEKGKHAPRKVGLAPVQRDGLEYEMTIAMDINHENIAHVTKDNTQLFNQQYIKPTKEMGRQIMEWLNSGLDVTKEFVEKTVPEILEKINACWDLNELRDCYAKSYKDYYEKFPEQFRTILDAKDRKKAELEKILETSNELGLGGAA